MDFKNDFKNLLKNLLKPGIPKIIVFLLITILASYFSKEDTCGVFLFFAFCYTIYGFPFSYIATGDINAEITISHLKTLFLGEYFSRYGKLLINPLLLLLNLILIYLLSCMIIALFDYAKLKIYRNKS